MQDSMLESPDITWACVTGYPCPPVSRMDQEDEEAFVDYASADVIEWVKFSPQVRKLFLDEYRMEYEEWRSGN